MDLLGSCYQNLIGCSSCSHLDEYESPWQLLWKYYMIQQLLSTGWTWISLAAAMKALYDTAAALSALPWMNMDLLGSCCESIIWYSSWSHLDEHGSPWKLLPEPYSEDKAAALTWMNMDLFGSCYQNLIVMNSSCSHLDEHRSPWQLLPESYSEDPGAVLTWMNMNLLGSCYQNLTGYNSCSHLDEHGSPWQLLPESYQIQQLLSSGWTWISLAAATRVLNDTAAGLTWMNMDLLGSCYQNLGISFNSCYVMNAQRNIDLYSLK